MTNLRQKKNNVFEVQINGGSIADKVNFGYGFFEKELRIDQVFGEQEVDVKDIGIDRAYDA